MTIPYQLAILLHRLTEAGCSPAPAAGGEVRARCPAHADSSPSLYVRLAEDKILLNCKAGCTANAICDALDHSVNDLFVNADEQTSTMETDDTLPVLPPNLPEVTLTAGGTMTVAIGTPGTDTTGKSSTDTRHSVYSEILAALDLSGAHFQALAARGLTPEQITRREYRTADADRARPVVDTLLRQYDREVLLTVPGFRLLGERLVFQPPDGLVIPVRGIGGSIVALKIRRGEAGTGGPKYVWVSSAGNSSGSPVHVPLGVPNLCETMRLTEGEMKADVATALSNMPTISAPGVMNWMSAIPILKALGTRKVLLAMDRDGKRTTLAATEQALLGLTREGFEVVLETWDGALAKGIDDLFAASRAPEVVAGLPALVRLRDELNRPPDGAADPEPEAEPGPFPTDVFPPRLATYTCEVAAATATPPDYAGVTMLVAAGSAVGNSRVCEVKSNSWIEGARVFAGLTGDPASGKSPVTDLVLRPLEEAESLAVTRYRHLRGQYDRAVAERERVAAENRGLDRDARLPLPPVPDEPPKPPRLAIANATVEATTQILDANPRGVLKVIDEGSGWPAEMNQYKGGRGTDRQFYLSAWSGRRYISDRVAQDGVPYCIDRPFVNILFGLQPDLLGELADGRGRRDGFLDRILFSWPRHPGAAGWTDATVSAESAAAWATTLDRLRKLEMVDTGEGVLAPRVIRLSPAAREAWVRWYDAHAAEMRDPSLPGRLVGPWAKMRSYSARLALILHLMWHVKDGDPAPDATPDLGPESIERAARLIAYFKSHARRVYTRLRQAPEDDRLDDVLDWIRRQGGECRARDLLRGHKVANSEAAGKLIKELEARGYGRCEGRDAPNGRKVTWFVFDPD